MKSSRPPSRASSTGDEPGSTAYTKVKNGYTRGMFDGVKTVDDFAEKLKVPKDSIPLVVPLDVSCRSPGCPFNAIERNGGHCPAHERRWYPLKSHRGCDMLGPDFLRTDENRMNCDCILGACWSAGYFPGQKPIYIPAVGRETVGSTTGLLSPDKAKALKDGEAVVKLYPWHFFPDHREKQQDGTWKLIYDKTGKTTYKDGELRAYSFPPPRYNVNDFVNKEHRGASWVRPQDRWAEENKASKMPMWMLNMLSADDALSPDSAPLEKQSKKDLQRTVEKWRARAFYLNDEAKGLKRKLEEDAATAAKRLGKVTAEKDVVIEQQRGEIADLKKRNAELEKEMEELRALLEQCRERKGEPLRYSDLYEGGVLSRFVDDFTLWKTVELNDAFLELINYADGSEGAFPEGDGLCENLRPYSSVLWPERSGAVPPPCLDAEEYKSFLANSTPKKGNRTWGKSTWKDDYLAWCIYVRGGTTEEFAAGICGITVKRMSDIFHEWAQVLDTALQEMFPRPTRSQMLRAYPKRFVEQDGHARCAMLLDACEFFCQESHNPNVSSSTHSEYKKHCTVKFLGATDPIGCAWSGSVPDGSPGHASDPIMTKDTKILRQVPFGWTAKVDKGFIVNDIAASEGMDIDRPQMRKKTQVQQSAADTGQTQKIGNTRIVVENVNGQVKMHLRYLNALIPTLQFGIVSKIVRIGYLLQNFKKAFIQRRDPRDKIPEGGRPCRAEIRWFGATDAGLEDVRSRIDLWGLQCEKELHKELSEKVENRYKKKSEISEVVLDKRLDLAKRRELYREHHGMEYDGGDM